MNANAKLYLDIEIHAFHLLLFNTKIKKKMHVYVFFILKTDMIF